MAKAKDLAALAGLAGLAYAMRNKDKSNEDAGDQKTSSYTGDTKKVAASDDRMSNEDYIKSRMKKAPEAEDANYGNEGRRTSMGVAPAPKTTTKAAPKLETYTTRKDPRLAETGTSRGRPAEAKNPNYSNEGRSSTAPSKSASTPAEPASTTTKVAAKPATRSTNILEEAKEEARRRAAASQATPTSTSSSTSPTTRYSFPGSSALNKKNGGAVKKMASGGMTASSRADGIASRGKTKCKMY